VESNDSTEAADVCQGRQRIRKRKESGKKVHLDFNKDYTLSIFSESSQ